MRRYRLNVGGRLFEIDVAELGADSFRVALDGRSYAVTIEHVADEARPAVTPMVEGFVVQAPAAAPLPASPAPASPAPASPAPAADRGALTAPMPGTVLTVEVSVGQPVRRGDPLLTLEAMKMQNVIRAPADAVVAELLVAPGQAVGYGEPLLRFEAGAL
jgi:biotin carboxyl carrier protein